ncbi:MAG: dTMP kinase [Candidatus Bathyarchaeota archaeon]|nr:MAG: dTMP kinase [Candidatus Bathyarchaeota archaeon]
MSLIALEGIDKSGKRTQTQFLLARLKKVGVDSESIAFPDYGTPLGKSIQNFLHGHVQFCPEVRQLLYVANRWERKNDIDRWLKAGKVVIANRYVPSGLVYGLANDLDLNWMKKLEEGLPPTNLVIVIDVTVDTAFNRFKEQKRDIYESNKPFLEKVRTTYLTLANELKWTVINGESSIEKIHEQIWRKVRDLLRSHSGTLMS